MVLVFERVDLRGGKTGVGEHSVLWRLLELLPFLLFFAGGSGKVYLFNNMFPSAGGPEPN